MVLNLTDVQWAGIQAACDHHNKNLATNPNSKYYEKTYATKEEWLQAYLEDFALSMVNKFVPVASAQESLELRLNKVV